MKDNEARIDISYNRRIIDIIVDVYAKHREEISSLKRELAEIRGTLKSVVTVNKELLSKIGKEPTMQIRDTPGMLGFRGIISLPIQDVILMLLDFLKLELESESIKLKEIVDDGNTKD